MNYEEFIKSKVIISEDYGFEPNWIPEIAKDHQKDICNWTLRGGRRAIFASFGLGKTFMQLINAVNCINETGKPFLIACPLGVMGEFKRDNEKLNTGFEIEYIKDTDTISEYSKKIYLTNYERIRKGDIKADKFGGVSFDEASILRNLKTETTNYIIKYFKQIPYRFVATATPSPNDYIEILNYSEFLGIADRGNILTKFFKRNPQKAGDLMLLESQKDDFWMWVSSWAVFINTPSDLGYENEGYDLPKLNVIEHRIENLSDEIIQNKFGDLILFKDNTKSLVDSSREKRDSMELRCNELEKILYICINSLNGKFNKEREVPNLVGEEQGSQLSEAKGAKQGSLSEKQRIIQREKQELEGSESRPNERASEESLSNREMEVVSEELLSGEYRENQSSVENKSPETIWNNNSTIRRNVAGPKKQMHDLQSNEQGICSEQKGRFSSGSLPLDRKSKRSTMPSLQRSIRTFSGQHIGNEGSYILFDETYQIVIWCDLNIEQDAVEKILQKNKISYVSLKGGESSASKEEKMNKWRDKKVSVFLSKTTMFGSGINMQQASEMIYVGITYKFQDFLQGIHREYRFGQPYEVNVHIIYTNNEDHVFSTLMKKWEKHKELQTEMIKLVREYGLNNELIRDKMERQIFSNGDKVVIGDTTLYNNDTVIISADQNEVPDNSVGMILTSIPFGNHYEYSDNYNDFGHNIDNDGFFNQMDFLVPNLHRMLIPGRVAAIHVKDRIRYSYQNGTSFTSMDDFSGDTVRSFKKHGFHLIGKITITTDVVRENNQTYRLGHSEKCKDGSKMGVGMPEYVLLFRKAPTNSDNAYSDLPIFKGKDEYPVERWQLDAHAYWRSSGDHYLDVETLKDKDLKEVWKVWKQYNDEGLYTFENHLKLSTELEKKGKISREYMTVPPHSNNDFVWTDVNRMHTLNARQVSNKKEKHICPLQIDIVERLIELFSMKGETVYEPFGGLMTVPTIALKMGRKAKAVELNSEYYKDGLFYVRSMHEKLNMPTLFDFLPELEKV